jgi:hypothetical protein
VKVWFDKATSQLLVEDETGRVGWDIYGVPLADVAFETETTPLGAVLCVARGIIITIANNREDTDTQHRVLLEPGQAMADCLSSLGSHPSPERGLCHILRRRSRAEGREITMPAHTPPRQ